MASLKLAATPGLLPDVGTIKLQFTEPDAATNVKITVFEADQWTIDGTTVTEGQGQDRKIGEIFGHIQGGKFVFENINTFFSIVAVEPIPPETAVKFVVPGIMNLTIDHDGTQSFVPLQNIDRDKELGFFEIVFEVTATVNGSPLSYRTPVPVFVRNVPSARAELVFLAGLPDDFAEPFTKLFFKNAADFWKPLKDNERNEIDLTSILEKIRTIPGSQRGDLPWGTVNIVAHGATSTWFIRKIRSEPFPPGLNAADFPDPALGPVPDASVLDEQSLIVLRGCEIGGDQKLLDAIRDQFGGRATVFAPLHEMVYRRTNGALMERLFQKWEIELPGTKPFPADAELKKLFQKKYTGHPLYGGFTDADWDAVVAIHETALGKDAFRQSEPIPAGPFVGDGLDHDDVFLPGSQTRRPDGELAKQAAVNVPVDEFEWTWTVGPDPNNASKLKLTGNGVETLYQVLRLLTVSGDGKGLPATPDLNNPKHFGHSS